MNTKKVLIASALWSVFPYILIVCARFLNLSEGAGIVLLNIINLLLGIAIILSVMLIIFGSIGYVWSNYTINKEKEKKFKEMLFYGVIILYATGVSYAILTPPFIY